MLPDPTIILNGTPHPLSDLTTVQGLLQSLGLEGVPVLVEYNSAALFPREFPTIALSAGDRVEIIRIVAGG